MTRQPSPKVAILSAVHLALDNRVFYREARTLARNGYDVTLIAVHHRDEQLDGVQIRALPRLPRARRPLLWRQLLRMARETEADVFHFHDPELLLVSPWLRRLSGKPTIYDIHEANADFIAVKDYLPKGLRRPLAQTMRYLEPQLASRENGLIFADDAIAGSFASFHGPRITLFNFPGQDLIDQGADPGPVYAEREPVVLYLGGLEPNRGSGIMLDVMERVVGQLPEARLLIVGHFQPPELEMEMRREAERRGISHSLQITGRVPFERIGDYLHQARIGWVTWQAYPKNEKNIPTKLFEYMAFGLPIVSSDLASIRPFVEPDNNGLLVVPNDSERHAEAIIRLLRDDEAALRLGLAGQQLVRTTYNWPAMEPRLLAFYKAVLSRSA